MLIANGAYLFVENIEHSTPVDLAEKYGHKEIALFLESKMLFSVSHVSSCGWVKVTKTKRDLLFSD